MTQNTKNSKRLFHGSVVALLAAAIATASLAGCGSGDNNKSTADEVVTETQVVTKVVNGVYVDENGNIVTDPVSGSAATAATTANGSNKQTSGSSQQNSAAGSNSGSGNSGNSGSANSQTSKAASSAGGSGSASTSKTDNTNRKTTPSNAQKGSTEKEAKPDTSAKDLTIGDKHYNVGDKVVCTYFLEVPETMLNFQGDVEYDSSMLKETSFTLVSPADYGAVMNEKEGKILFNGSMLNGYDFTSPGYEFVVVEFEVLKTGTTTPAITFDVITDLNGKSYAGANGALSNGANVWAVFS